MTEANRAAFSDGCSRQEAGSDRRVIRGNVHVLKSGCRWCDCPEGYGPPTTIYDRLVRWARRGVWENLFRELAGNGRLADTQMIDSTQHMENKHPRQMPAGPVAYDARNVVGLNWRGVDPSQLLARQSRLRSTVRSLNGVVWLPRMARTEPRDCLVSVGPLSAKQRYRA